MMNYEVSNPNISGFENFPVVGAGTWKLLHDLRAMCLYVHLEHVHSFVSITPRDYLSISLWVWIQCEHSSDGSFLM